MDEKIGLVALFCGVFALILALAGFLPISYNELTGQPDFSGYANKTDIPQSFPYGNLSDVPDLSGFGNYGNLTGVPTDLGRSPYLPFVFVSGGGNIVWKVVFLSNASWSDVVDTSGQLVFFSSYVNFDILVIYGSNSGGSWYGIYYNITSRSVVDGWFGF